MRKVQLGVFQDYIVSYGFDWDNMMIGQHSAIRRKEREQAETRGLEYYIKDENGYITLLKNVSSMEKFMARIGYAFNTKRNKVVAGRVSCSKEEDIPMVNDLPTTSQNMEHINAEKQELQNLKAELLKSTHKNEFVEEEGFEEEHQKSR